MSKSPTIKTKLFDTSAATEGIDNLALNNVIAKIPLHKESRSLRQLARLFLDGDSKETLHVKTLSGAMFAAIDGLDTSATASEFVSIIKSVKDVALTSTIGEPTKFAPSISMKAILDSITVVLPNGKYAIDDVGKSSGYARAKSANSLRRSISRVLTEITSHILTINTVSGFLVEELSDIDIGSTIDEVISIVQTALSETTSISIATEENVTMTSVRNLLSRLVKKDIDDAIFLDDHPLTLNDDHVTFSSSKELLTNIIKVSGSGFFLRTALGELASDLADLGSPTTSEILGLI